MQFALTPEQEMIADTARGVMADFAPGLRTTISTDAGYDTTQWAIVTRDMGFGAMTLPETDGGAGLGLVEQMLVMIEMGRTLFPSPFLPSIATALPLIRLAGSAEQAARLSPAIAGGETIAAYASGGSLAVADGRLSGEALVPFGHAADWFVVRAGAAVAVVPASAATVERPVTMDLTRPLARVRFADAEVEPLERPDRATAALDRARVALAAECVGGADAALAVSVDYAQQRIQFGRPIGSFQALKHIMADMMVAAEAARSAVYYAAAAIDEDDPAAPEAAAIAHATAIDAFSACAAQLIQIHGGIGFTWEHDAQLFFKRARSAATLLGTPAESRERLATLIGLDEMGDRR